MDTSDPRYKKPIFSVSKWRNLHKIFELQNVECISMVTADSEKYAEPSWYHIFTYLFSPWGLLVVKPLDDIFHEALDLIGATSCPMLRFNRYSYFIYR